MKTPIDRSRAADCVFLCCVVFISALPYLFGLGFYADDWWYQATLAHFSGQGVAAMFRELYLADPGMLVRPVQMVFLVLGFDAFGLHATLYHIADTGVLGLVAALVYLVLREVRAGRSEAFLIALVFALLPHYSTDRFWISAQQATLSMVFALLGVYALLRSFRPMVMKSKWWVGSAIIALILSMLSYEVTVGLIIGAFVAMGVKRCLDARVNSGSFAANLGGVAITATVLAFVGLIKARLQSRIVYHHHFFAFFMQRTWRTLDQAVRFSLWTYCLKMPSVLISLSRHAALTRAGFAVAAFVSLVVGAYLWRCMGAMKIPTRRACLHLVLLGLVLFFLGFVLFVSAPDIDFSAPGLDNRVAIASGLGASCVLVGLAGLACSLLNSPARRAGVFIISIAVLCGLNCLVVSGMGFFWVDAASRQSMILRSLAHDVQSIPQGSLLLLDGFCRFSGPGAVFFMEWDATGAVQLTLKDYSLRGDVVSPNLQFGNSVIKTSTSGEPIKHYDYGDRLFIYNTRLHTLTALPSRGAAEAYLKDATVPPNGECPAIQDENGVRVF